MKPVADEAHFVGETVAHVRTRVLGMPRVVKEHAEFNYRSRSQSRLRAGDLRVRPEPAPAFSAPLPVLVWMFGFW